MQELFTSVTVQVLLMAKSDTQCSHLSWLNKERHKKLGGIVIAQTGPQTAVCNQIKSLGM